MINVPQLFLLQQPTNAFSIVLEITEDEKRFGFSVVGGVDEGFHPRIDEVVEGTAHVIHLTFVFCEYM